MQAEQLGVVRAPELQRFADSDGEVSGPRGEGADHERRMPEDADDARGGEEPKPAFHHPEGARVLEAPGEGGADIGLDEGPRPFLVGPVPSNLALRRAVPRGAVLRQQLVVEAADGLVLLVPLPVERGRVIDFAEVEPGRLEAPGQERSPAPVHAENDHARGRIAGPASTASSCRTSFGTSTANGSSSSRAKTSAGTTTRSSGAPSSSRR